MQLTCFTEPYSYVYRGCPRGAPFTVDPPEWYVFNSRVGGRGARAGTGTSFGLAVVPRVYRVFAGLLTP